MSINLTITAETGEEFSHQLRALVSVFGLSTTSAIMPEIIARGSTAAEASTVEASQDVAVGEPAKATRGRSAVKPKAASTPASEPSTASSDEASSDTSTTNSEPEPKSSDGGSTPSSPETKPLSFDADVAPKVVEYVQKLGREVVTCVLGQFGVAKASQLDDPAQWQELLNALADAEAGA